MRRKILLPLLTVAAFVAATCASSADARTYRCVRWVSRTSCNAPKQAVQSKSIEPYASASLYRLHCQPWYFARLDDEELSYGED
jgi:hypothetical protein